MMRRSRMVAAAAIAAVAVLVGVGAVWSLRDDDGPRETAKRYLAAWSGGDFAAMHALTDRPPADFETRFARMRDDLGVTRQHYEVASVGDAKHGEAGGSYRAALTLTGGRAWTYGGSLTFVERDGKWRVAWSPQVMYPSLKEGQRLRAARTWPSPGGHPGGGRQQPEPVAVRVRPAARRTARPRVRRRREEARGPVPRG